MPSLSQFRHFASILCLCLGAFVVWQKTDPVLLDPAAVQNASNQKRPKILKGNSNRPSVAVSKTTYSNKVRFVFFAGLGGTGHHGWKQTLEASRLCQPPSKAIGKALHDFWWDRDEHADTHARTLGKLLKMLAAQEPAEGESSSPSSKLYCLNCLAYGSMMSYPNFNDPTHHPNVLTLAHVAELARVDLRIVVLHRHPTNQLVSLCLHRTFLPLAEESHQMANQAAFLNAQLEQIDPQFFLCVGYDQVLFHRSAIQEFVTGGLSLSVGYNENNHNNTTMTLSQALQAEYKPRTDDPAVALQEILAQENGQEIRIKIEEMEIYYQHLKNVICQQS